MVWEPNQGEIVFYDNLDTVWFGNLMDGKVNGQPILDIDDAFDSETVNGITGKAKNRFFFVTRKQWGHSDIDYVLEPLSTSQDGVRRDCDGPSYDTEYKVAPFVDSDHVYTCVKSIDDKWSVAGDSYQGVYLNNHASMIQTRYGGLPAAINPVIRIFTSKDVTNEDIIYITAFTVNFLVIELTFDRSTETITATLVTSLNNPVVVTGDVVVSNVIDVCQDYSNNRYMVKSSTTSYLLQRGAATRWDSIDLVLGWNASVQMSAMEFITNQWVIIMDFSPAQATWYDTQNNALVPITITNEAHHKWTHILPYDDGKKAILIGVYDESLTAITQEQIGKHRMRIYTVDLEPPTGESATITPVPLFSLDSYLNPNDSWDTYFAVDGRTVVPGSSYINYKAEIFRGRRRYGTNEFWLVSSGRDEILTIGERLSTVAFTATGKTSTSNILNWSPPDNPEFENIAWQTVERAHCASIDEEPTKFYCVWAADKVSGLIAEEAEDYFGWPCYYEDNQHPTILPQEIDDTGVFTEVGLVTQSEIHDYDPQQDDWPGGRPFWYKYHRVSYLNIESDCAIQTATTKQPIQPVEIKDTKDNNLDYNDIVETARSFQLEWDWTPLGSTDATDFMMWQVAFFEDQNPSVYIGDWSGLRHFPQPMAFDGTDDEWRWILPWTQFFGDHEIICWANDASFNTSLTTKVIDKKYVRWDDNPITDGTDKRYSPLLPDTTYNTTVIGWDKGGLWRSSAKMSHVPPSQEAFANSEMFIERQIVPIRTLSETTYAAGCSFVPATGGDTFKRWDEVANPPAYGTAQVIENLGGQTYVAQEFFVDYEVTISKIDIYISNIVNVPIDPGVLVVGLVDETEVLGIPTPWNVIGTAQYVITPAEFTGPGWYTHEFDPPVVFRPGKFFVRFLSLPVVAAGPLWELRTNQWIGDTDRGAWINNPWRRNPDEDINIRLYINDSKVSEGFVINSGDLLTFDLNKSTMTDGTEPIFEDNAYLDTNLWTVLRGQVADQNYVDGALVFTPTQDLYMVANGNEYYGIETRSFLMKTSWKYDDQQAANAEVNFLIHEQAEHARINTIQRDYQIKYDLVTGRLRILQNDKTNTTTLWDSSTAPALPVEKPSAADEWFDIWIKIVDDTISVFVEKDGYTVEENYDLGNSIAKQTIWNDGTDYYDFTRYGYLMLLIPDGHDMSMDYMKLYGRNELSGLEGGEGSKIDWGDESDSGFIPANEIEKIYQIEPDDDTEPYDAKVLGKNINAADDLGFVPAWLDYPEEIAQSDYDRQTFEFEVDNAPPTAILNTPGDGYSGVPMGIDAIGSVDPEGGELIYRWTYGDGTVENTTTPYVTHTYNTTGTFLVTLQTEDEVGNLSSLSSEAITIRELFEDFVELEFNHPLTRESVARVSGVSSSNIPDRCGGEIQDVGPGNRVFNISGLHAPPRCCCTDVTDWRLVLDLENICTTVFVFGEDEEETVTPAPAPALTCSLIIYESAIPGTGTCNVGDINGAGAIFQQANMFTPTSDIDICAISFFPVATTLSGFPWLVSMTVQGDFGGVPDGIPISTVIVDPVTLVLGVWNKFTLPATLSLNNGVTYWIVWEPLPCPIGSGQPDFIEISTSILNFATGLDCNPVCIPVCIWAPHAPPDEVSFILWGLI